MNTTHTRVGRHLFPLVAAFVLVLWSCDSGDTPESSETPASSEGSGTIVVACTTDMRSVNELTADATIFHQALHTFILFLTLLEEQADFEKGPPTFEPRLAESYEFSDDRRVLTFKLRENHFWSDGAPITAEDVRWTWQAQVHPDVAWSMRDAKKHIRDVEVVDPLTVRFHFDKVTATQLIDVNLGSILPKHAWSRLPFSEWRQRADWFVDNLVVSGSFTLDDWQPGQRIVLRRNEHYFEPGRPRAERLVLRITPDRAGQLALLRSGQAHLIEWARPADVLDLQQDPNIEIRSYIPRSANGLVWNVENPLFATRQVRQALTLAIDRQKIVDALYYGYAKVTDSVFPTNLWAYNKDLQPWPYDPARARELLASQGWTDSDGDGVLDRGGERFSFEVLTPAGNELREDILVMVQDQLAEVGVEARQRAVEFNTMMSRSRQHDFEAAFSGVGISTDLDLSFYFHSKHIPSGYNTGSYSSPEVDRILDEIGTQVDQIDAKPLYYRLQEALYEDLPVTILYEPVRLVPIRKALRNTSPNVLSTYYGVQEWEIRE